MTGIIPPSRGAVLLPLLLATVSTSIAADEATGAAATPAPRVDRAAARLLLGTMTDLDPSLLAHVTMPTLVVCGSEDRDNGSAAELAALLPHATYGETPGTHLISATKPEMGEAIVHFLAG